MSDTPSMQEVIRRRLETGFVGRQDLLGRFGENLGLAADDPKRRFLVSVQGPPGTGKTALLHQLQRVALDAGARVAVVDEHVFDVPGAMASIAAQLRRQRAPLRAFERRHRRYEERRAALLADPPGLSGASLLLARLAVRLGLRAAQTVPVVGPVADLVDPDLLVEQGDHVYALVSRALRSRDDARLVLAPTEELSPSFVEGLGHAATRHPVALFFDGYERLAPLLDGWLLDLVQDGGPYGELPGNLTITIASREPLDPRRWADLLTEIEAMELGPFSEAEARQLLAGKGVRDEAVIQAIFALSGLVPLLVATLAEGTPIDPAALAEPGGDAVEHFLHWLADERRREIALVAALPRTVDEDALAALQAGDGETAELYDWLRGLPFVQEREDGCRYHELVRTPLLRLQRMRAGHRWRQNHRRLAEHNRRCREELELPDDAGWADAGWQRYALEEAYHRLCATPVAGLHAALAGAVQAYQAGRPLARRWAEMLRQAGGDTGSAEIARWGDELMAAAGEDEDCWPGFVTALLDRAPLSPSERALALGQRAECHAIQQRFDEALADFGHAIALDPSSAALVAARGQTLQLLGRSEEALRDLDRAIELAPDSEAAIANRGVILRHMGRYREALADLDRAVELRPGDDWAIAQRGETRRRMGDHLTAVADFTEAIRLNPSYRFAYASRGLARRRLGHHREELADLTRAIQLDPEYGWALANRGVTYRQLGRYEEALADFDRALAPRPDYVWALVNRGLTLRQAGRYTEALADLDRALALEPRNAWAAANRGETLHLLGRDGEALRDLDLALALQPDSAWALARRGGVRRRLGDDAGALADFERALALDPEEGAARYGRGVLLLGGGRREEAAAELDAAVAAGRRSLESRPGDPAGLLRLAVYESARGRAEAASPLFQEAVAHGAPDALVEAALHELRALAALEPGAGVQRLVERFTRNGAAG